MKVSSDLKLTIRLAAAVKTTEINTTEIYVFGLDIQDGIHFINISILWESGKR